MDQTSVAHGAAMSLEAFRRLPEQAGLQLIDGFVVKEPSPGYGHQACVARLYVKLATFVEAHALGETCLAPLDVYLAGHVLQPDVFFVSRARLGIIHSDGLHGAPDLAVEVLSPSTGRYDAGRKRELYFAHGCRELWLIDPSRQTLRRLADAAGAGDLLTAADVLATPLLPGLTLKPTELFKVPGSAGRTNGKAASNTDESD